jgi:small-conductance mechanosensitive channel
MNPLSNNMTAGHSFALSLAGFLRGGIERLGGPGTEQVALGALTWADLGVAALFILLALLVNSLLALFFHRKIREAVGRTGTGGAGHHYLRALGRPVHVLVWIYGAYLALTPLLPREGGGGWKFLGEGLARLLDLGVFCSLLWLFFRLTRVLEARLKDWSSRTSSKLDDLFVPLLVKSLRTVVPVVGIIFALPILNLPDKFSDILAKASSILLIVVVALVLCQVVALVERTVLAEYDITASDNLRARKVYTQVHVISKTLYVLIILFAIASVLMLFKEVQRFGTSILASAGVVGVIMGFAAQKMIANLFAGFQLAMTQPIRLDDVVIVEGEWGRIEEITLTYVVVHIWDDRRLVVPLSYFIDKPFQNWTRTSADLMGSVFLWTDYTLPLEEVRGFLKGLIEPHPLWDKRFWNLQVTDATEHTMQIRVLVTSADSSKSWDLRCDVREKLVAFLQQKYPQCLPRMRADLFRDGKARGPKPA